MSLEIVYNGIMTDASRPMGLHIQQNRDRMEILCAKCNCLGELDAIKFDTKSTDVWRDVAECFSAFGWTCKEGRTLCRKYSGLT